jgi:hypothetical protein
MDRFRLGGVAILQVATFPEANVPRVKEQRDTLKVDQHCVDMRLFSNEASDMPALLREFRLHGTATVADVAAVAEAVVATTPGAIGESSLFLIVAERANHQAIARQLFEQLQPGSPLFVVGGDLLETGTTLWKGPTNDWLVLLGPSADVLDGWARELLAEVESCWHESLAKRTKYEQTIRDKVREAADKLETLVDQVAAAFESDARDEEAIAAGVGEASDARLDLGNCIESAVKERKDLEYYRASLATCCAEAGDCPGAAVLHTRLAAAELSLRLIDLDISAVENKIKRTDWLLAEHRRRVQEDEQRQRNVFETVTKRLAVPAVVLSIVSQAIQSGVHALDLEQRAPALRPFVQWTSIAASGFGILACLLFLAGVALYFVKQKNKKNAKRQR